MRHLWSVVLLLAVSGGLIAIQPSRTSASPHVLRDGGGGLCPTKKICKP